MRSLADDAGAWLALPVPPEVPPLPRVSLSREAPKILASSVVGFALVVGMGLMTSSRPNVLVLVVDTLRADAISAALHNDKTPHIAELAAHGTLFPHAFSHAPMTLPAHTSIFTGRHPHETGVYNNGEPVSADMPLLAEALQSAGYQTEAVVSLATLWPEGERRGLARGFDHFDSGELPVAPAEEAFGRVRATMDRLDPSQPFFLFAHLSDPHEPYNEHAPHFDPKSHFATAEIRLDGEPLDVVTTSKMSHWEAKVELSAGEHALVFQSDRPFKLRSFECRAEGVECDARFVEGVLLEYGTRFELRLDNSSDGTQQVELRAWLNDEPPASDILSRYQSEVAAADAAIGQLVEELKVRGLWENTLVVLTSDHGEALGEHGTIGHVVNLYDELLHVPLIVRLPGDALDERLAFSAQGIVRHIDLAPTILQVLGLPDMVGQSGASLFEPADRLLLAETHPPEAPRTLFAARDDAYKLVFDPLADSFELYRLASDPQELDDVYEFEGHMRKSWEAELRRLARSVEPQGARAQELQRKLSALGY